MPQGQGLKELREGLGLTQQQVAEFFDSSQALISLFELGKRRVDAAGIKRLAEALTNAVRSFGSTRVVTFDEVSSALDESRARASDLPRVDHPAAAPSAQEA